MQRHDPHFYRYSTPGQDLKWTGAALAIVGLLIAVIALAVFGLL